MSSVMGRVVVACLLLGACAPEEELATGETELAAGRVFGIEPMSDEACAVLTVANRYSRADLVAGGVPARAATSIDNAGVLGTLERLDALRDVGKKSFEGLQAIAQRDGVVCGGGMVRVLPIRRGAPVDEQWAAFRDGDGAWSTLPPTDGALVFPVADAAGRYEIAMFCRNEATDNGNFTGDIVTLALTTAEARDLVLDRDLKDFGCGSRYVAPWADLYLRHPGEAGTRSLLGAYASDLHILRTNPQRYRGEIGTADLIVFDRTSIPALGLVRRNFVHERRQTVRFDWSEMVPLERHEAPILNFPGGHAPSVYLRTASGTQMLASDPLGNPIGSLEFFGLPASLRSPGDYFHFEAGYFPDQPDFFHVDLRGYAAEARDVVIDLPEMARPEGTFVQAADRSIAMHFVPYPGGAALYDFSFLGSTGPSWIYVRSAARVVERADVALPSFAGLPGFKDTWALGARPSGGNAVLVVRNGDTARLFQPAQRLGMSFIIAKR